MPLIVRTFLKTALLYFVAALLLNIAIALQRAGVSFPPRLDSVYIHLVTVGWISQLIIGVAVWMFPKYSKDQPRGPEWVNWTIYALLNAGLLLRVISEPAAASGGGEVWGVLLLASALLQWCAGVLFAVTAWRRVRLR